MHPKLSQAVARQQLTAMADPDHLVDWRLLLALEAVHTAGVIDRLPGDVDQISLDLDLDATAVATCLQILVAWELLERDGQTFAWTEPRLSKDELTMLAQHGVWIRRWAANLGPRLHDRQADSPITPPGLPAEAGLRLLRLSTQAAVDPIVRVCWDALAERQPESGRPRVLDLGGGHGAYAVALRDKGAEVTLQDLPVMIEYLGVQDELEGIGLVAADMHKTLAGKNYDLVLLSTVTNMFDAATVAALLRRVAGRLAPNGTLVVVSYFRERGTVGAAFGAQMLAATTSGDAHGENDYRAWLTAAGLTYESTHQLTTPPLSAIVARKI